MEKDDKKRGKRNDNSQSMVEVPAFHLVVSLRDSPLCILDACDFGVELTKPQYPNPSMPQQIRISNISRKLLICEMQSFDKEEKLTYRP